MMRKYNANIVQARALQVTQKRERFARRWALILERFGDFCRRCNNKYPAVVYDLHHPNGKSGRDETPAKIVAGGSEARFLAMLNDVELLCANCHRLHHAEVGDWAPAKKKA